jgi:hypothetical protein
MHGNPTPFEALKGLTLTNVEVKGDEEIHFYVADGRHLVMHHDQDCCELVYIESIVGDVADLIGTPILLAEGVESGDTPPPESKYGYDSFTWTFYKLATVKGYVDIRWFGSSNGYYSESVALIEVMP